MQTSWYAAIADAWRCERTENAVRFVYPAPENARGFYPYGFVRKNDSAADFMDWYGLELLVDARGDDAVFRGEAAVCFASGETLRLPVSAPVTDGKALVGIPFADFPCEHVKSSLWQFVEAVEVSFPQDGFGVEALTALRRPGVWLDIPIRGKAADAEETVQYDGTVCSCRGEPLCVSLAQALEGWESMKADIRLSGADGQGMLVLPPYGHADFSVRLRMHGNIPAGGHEETLIRATGRGKGAWEDTVPLQTLRKLPHPYIYHDRAGWRAVREKIEKYPCYQPAFRQYVDTADKWTVSPPMENRPFCYETKVETELMSAAYAYILTGKTEYALKIAAFFRYFTDPETGYPARKRGCSQSYVQEGHFFQHLAIPFDIIYDSGVLTDGDKAAVEAAFRLYMEMLGRDICSGHISNWIISEAQGALYCALAIQDMDLVQRFAFGNGGLVEQFRHGIFNDGWWYECSVGYNTWVSSMMIHMAHALRPFGYDLAYARFPIPFNQEVGASVVGRPAPVRMGMYNQKWGGNIRNYACIKDMFDAPLPFLDSRGVLFGISDSDEKRLSGVHFGSTYDLAYTYYHDERYLPVIRRTEADPIFGHPELDQGKPFAEAESDLSPNAYADNIGIMVLRSRKAGRRPTEQIQAVLRYGSHGFAHGHFDIGQLLSVMRYGRSFYNPECCWWGYGHFLYKFYVQCSLTKNMVVVDDKMQVPADSRRILFESGARLQAAGIEVTTSWAYPPYGGMYYQERGEGVNADGLRKRLQYNRCDLPIAEGPDAPRYGSLTDFTEPIRQRRVMAVLDDCIVLFDAMQGEKEHVYDSLMQIRGFRKIDGEKVTWLRHTEQMSGNIISDAQFITDCDWYRAEGPTAARFETVFGEGQPAGDRTSWNVPGVLKMDVHTAWPPVTEQMVGRVATDNRGYSIPMDFRIEGDGETLARGSLNGWILGRRETDVDVTGRKMLSLVLSQGCREDEIGRPIDTPQGCFYGSVILEKADGTMLDVGEALRENPAWAETENVDTGFGIGRDYRNGRVTIVGTEYPNAIPASTVDHRKEGRITLSLAGLNAVRLRVCVGVDAFPGPEEQYRRTYAVRTRGVSARFITVIEPYEKENRVLRVEARNPDSVTVYLRDGGRQTVSVAHLEDGTPKVTLTEA